MYFLNCSRTLSFYQEKPRSAYRRPRFFIFAYLILHQAQIPLHDRRRQQEFLFHVAKAYRDHIRLDGCYRANAKRLMLDLDTNFDFGNIHLHRGLRLSGWLAVQTKARLCYSNANARPSRAGCKAAGNAPKWYSSKMTRSQLMVCTHSLRPLMVPVVLSTPR